MTNAQAFLRKKLLCKIHTHRVYKEVKANGAWGDYLALRFGVESCKELSISELKIVLDCLDGVNTELNFEPDIRGRAVVNKEAITQKQIVQILGLKEVLGWEESAWRAFVYRQIKVMLWSESSLYGISKKQASSLITGLEKTAAHIAHKE